MARSKKELQGDESGMDMTPMIDVVFLLIIFFMCVTEMQKIEYESLTLPKAVKAIEDVHAPKNRIVVNITYVPSFRTNTVVSDIIIRKKKFNAQDRLIAFLKNQAAKDLDEQTKFSNITVKVRADQRVEYQKVQQVMVACMKAGISKISFGAEPRKQG